MTASIPEMQTLFTVAAVAVSGIPAMSADTRATLRESKGSMQQPKRTSLISPASMPARLTASRIATLPINAAFKSRSDPPNEPTAVRQADTITTSSILFAPYKIFLKKYFLTLLIAKNGKQGEWVRKHEEETSVCCYISRCPVVRPL